MDILLRGLFSVCGQCQVAKDASNFCSEWVSVSVFTLIVSSRVFASKVSQKKKEAWLTPGLFLLSLKFWLMDFSRDLTRWLFFNGDFWLLVVNANGSIIL